jgi:hypothetical protein
VLQWLPLQCTQEAHAIAVAVTSATNFRDALNVQSKEVKCTTVMLLKTGTLHTSLYTYTHVLSTRSANQQMSANLIL